MHIYFSGIGGVGIGPLSLIAKKLDFDVSGSDLKDSEYIDKCRAAGIEVSIGQTKADIEKTHKSRPIDWFVYSSALPMQNPNHPELAFVKDNDIKHTKRDDFLSHILQEKHIKMLAVAGTHGKTTTTAMCVWLFHQLGTVPYGYSIGGSVSFAPMGDIQPKAEWFIYEADEFDRNFLSYRPELNAVTGIAYDHHEIYPSEDDYNQAFRDYILQAEQTLMWQTDHKHIYSKSSPSKIRILKNAHPSIELLGEVNRLNATLAVYTVSQATGAKIDDLLPIINAFPGVSRRFETLAPGLVTDYAHTPEKITGALKTAQETSKNIVVIHEGLTNQRQHFIRDQYGNLFDRVKKLYWVPSYLAREPQDLKILSPSELIKSMNNRDIAEPAELNDDLKAKIDQHLADGDLVLALSGGGAESLDTFLRSHYL